MAVDEDPVANGVDQVGADEGEHHRLDEPHALQVTAEGRVDEQRHRAPGERLEERRGLGQNGRMHAELAQRGITGKEQEHDQRAEDQAEVQSLNQPAVALLAPAGSESLRHQGVQAQEQPHAEDRHGEEERIAQADRADGNRTEPADEDGIDDPHGHPAQLGQDHGAGQPEHGTKLGLQSLSEPAHGILSWHGPRQLAISPRIDTLNALEVRTGCTLTPSLRLRGRPNGAQGKEAAASRRL